MKILIVNKFLYQNGGSETYVFGIGKCLQEMGNEVQYFGMENENNIVFNDQNLYTNKMDFHSSKFSNLTYPIKTIYSTDAKNKISKLLNAFEPDVVHINNFNYQLTPSIIYAINNYKKRSNKKVKIVFTTHDYQLLCPNHMMNIPSSSENCEKCLNASYINCIKNKCVHNSTVKSILGSLEGSIYNSLNTYKYFDIVICPSEFMKNKMEQKNVFKGKVIAMHNFIDTPKFTDDVNFFDKKENYVLYFGRFDEEKGIKTLVEVAKELKDIQFVFAGKGNLENELKNISNIKNVGFKIGTELTDLIKKAKLSIYPSQWFENCPFSIMESQMLGTAVIGANIGGIPELVKDGINGVLFEPKNKNDLKSKIEKLFYDEEKCKLYSNNCLKTTYLNTNEYCKKLLEIYK